MRDVLVLAQGERAAPLTAMGVATAVSLACRKSATNGPATEPAKPGQHKGREEECSAVVGSFSQDSLLLLGVGENDLCCLVLLLRLLRDDMRRNVTLMS